MTCLPLVAALLLSDPAAAATPPPAGEDFHVPLFVRDMGEFWETRVLGETPVSTNTIASAAELIDNTLSRCSGVSTVVVEPDVEAPWRRTADLLVSLQATGKTVALRAEGTEIGLTGTGLFGSETKLKRASSSAAVLSLSDDVLAVDGRPVCELQPSIPLCGGNFKGVRAAVGGRAVVVHGSNHVNTGLVLTVHAALADHDLRYGATGKKGELRAFEARLLQGRISWVQETCEMPLESP